MFDDFRLFGSIDRILQETQFRLAAVSQTAALDAQVLLAHVLGKPRSRVLAHPEAVLNAIQAESLNSLMSRLESGEPLPYVIGHWEFFNLEFLLTPAVLIPRPETELLVERALAWLRLHPDRSLALDVGTGSGCIAVSLAVNQLNLHILASDISLEALKVAQDNVHRHGLSQRVHLLVSELSPAVSQKFDLICANLPYIPSAKLAHLPVARWEPQLALDGGVEGTIWIERLLSRVPAILASGGLVLLEIEASQGAQVRRLAQAAFPHAQVQLLLDLAGHERLVNIQAS